mmetsp:Transcript_27360/g.49703  ORF Transcript_27360/g.49703 Transcript_27360/m.49703 type:complete len:83 (+) Transcript_27360:35-283(+)
MATTHAKPPISVSEEKLFSPTGAGRGGHSGTGKSAKLLKHEHVSPGSCKIFLHGSGERAIDRMVTAADAFASQRVPPLDQTL